MADRPELHDPRVLRAFAHPVRNRILTELEAHGPLRAADVAQLLGIPANSASFHLRQLAKFGLVEEDPTAARDRRDRVWRATDEAGFDVSLGEIEKTPGGRAASKAFRQTKEAWAHRLVEEAYGDDRTEGTHRSITEQAVLLTKAEARELTEELVDVIDAWRTRNQDGDPGGSGGSDDSDGERRTYHVFQIIQPFPDQPLEP
ncbi:MAG TPA: helix-turn-helix domain-containing protein [Nocardioides sp.]|uniref:ArsR/SmtB family transcription factor n=1 Tax=uncultured Nocardioides sp. TaxID=198441 RepID=UPI000ED7227B|nr:helix-turn-helix domain-containing protein [uncultured Nocardioides sp.]HCB05638.1 transcriptional regulator [Nocardioides sp.]HRD62325.1 helix-turn-helix domain-containing protein [Nocardioides sp.]HRI96979.1 helix-turn-helix domain-containing protein [Nocardioides sp.]HRK45430.1 helix-turn-helix domain-containing protein [Nocardioides sp.]